MKVVALLFLVLICAGCDVGPAPTTETTQDAHLVITRYLTMGVGTPNVFFIRDTPSDDCWIVVTASGYGATMQRASSVSCPGGEKVADQQPRLTR